MNSTSYNWVIGKSKEQRLWGMFMDVNKTQGTMNLSFVKTNFFLCDNGRCVTQHVLHILTRCPLDWYISVHEHGRICRCGRCFGKNSWSGAIGWESGEPKCTVIPQQSSVYVLLIINFSFNLPKASNMKRVRNKLWKNVCSLLFNNKEGRKMEGEKVKRIGIFVIMRGILIFEVRNVYLIKSHMKYTFDIKIKKERKKTIKRRRSRVLKTCTCVTVNKAFLFFISML